ncbi:SLC13 family permease [Sphingomonas astaxanthinifaciens]|uniref:Di- and tricarboxylate transporter n=1 Tax=Sphingomonas astaxanthinifaciens DSM 22298 TaxID=1123267 RepID=A0ABQ5Z1G3_9SPHN|nr:DASS family sodium-coupled anion symporter [Sphingomonas astaxanthinifaciens]GLR46598.1 di- and tricarboxylate transporter [Sphingomonas astaxanthinifaciens DSM 22298]
MAQRWGLWGGLVLLVVLLLLPPPAGMPLSAWRVVALAGLMAVWWMTQALPLTATALMPFLLLPLFGVMTATDTAAAYYSPILFLVLGGAIIALAIERTGLHRRLALAIVNRGGKTPGAMLLAFMAATAIVSMIVSNTATTLIMMPIAIAVIRAARIEPGHTDGFAGALAMGIAFAASIGGLATLVGSPTNAIAAGIIERAIGLRIDFLMWASFGVPLVLVAIPLCWLILMRVQRVAPTDFDAAAAISAIGEAGPWSSAEKRLVPIILVTVAAWVVLPLVADRLPKDVLVDGTVAVAAALLLFVIPDGSGRPILTWTEANRAPWDVIMLFGGGLALAAGIGASGLDKWLGVALAPLKSVHPLLIALALVALVVFITEFASNVAAASGIIPVVAGIIAATGIDPILLALPAAWAASWGFMLPSGTGPNAIAWATGHISLPRMLRAGLWIDLAGVPLLVAMVWLLAPFVPR